ncbi:MAG: hypothetical protein ABJB65_07000 [Chloroflexota bacterium]
MHAAVRILTAVIAGLLIAVGLLAIAIGQVLGGAWTLLVGLAGVVAVLYEQRRYGAERPLDVDARFQPTDEVFVDPSTGRRMRVHIDPQTGERRYLPESGEPDRRTDR